MAQHSDEIERTSKTKDVLAHFGIAQSTLANLLKEGLPHTPGKTKRAGHRYSIPEVSAWIKRTGRSLKHGGDQRSPVARLYRGTGRPPKDVDEIAKAHAEAKLRKDLAAAERAELALEQERGKLLDAEDVKEAQIERVAYARNVLLGVPARVGEQVPEEYRTAVEDAVREEIRAALEELAKE